MKVIITRRAAYSIDRIAEFISKEGYPDTANRFLERMKVFIDQLNDFPEKYEICKQPSYNKRGFRCVPFEKKLYDHL